MTVVYSDTHTHVNSFVLGLDFVFCVCLGLAFCVFLLVYISLFLCCLLFCVELGFLQYQAN